MSWNVEEAVRKRYSEASQARQPELCCPVQYDQQWLAVIPEELILRDYGCGDPSRWVSAGETVLDLGSGGGKICYIASQIVGAEGRVIGVDMNDDMLQLARTHRQQIGESIGWHNVEFHKGRIQDLALDLDALDRYLSAHPVEGLAGWLEVESFAERMRRESPMIPDATVDVVLSNCVLNLVQPSHRRQLFQELHRVLRRGGRAVISDIVSDEPVPDQLRENPELWSGCIGGAFVESEFLAAFEAAGLYGVELVDRQTEPWAVVEGIEFRSVTVRAFKGKEGPCLDRKQAVIYRGPWKTVTDDDGIVLERGQPMAVCDKTFSIYSRAPYQEHIVPVPPSVAVPREQATPFDCRQPQLRAPSETKGDRPVPNSLPLAGCCGDEPCC